MTMIECHAETFSYVRDNAVGHGRRAPGFSSGRLSVPARRRACRTHEPAWRPSWVCRFEHWRVASRPCQETGPRRRDGRVGIHPGKESRHRARSGCVICPERADSADRPSTRVWEGAPDLAVEVLSPDNRGAALRSKVRDYLARGVVIVVVIDPDKESLTVHRRLSAPIMLTSGNELDLDDVVEGFRCQVREIFN